MDRNLALYPAYQAARNATFWLPVFFLYFASVCSVAEVFVLEAIYYAGVVVLEVPSGYLSDRWGRKPTLVCAAACVAAAHVVFATTGSFASFAIAQLLLAAGMAFNSGTDSALLFDSLSVKGDPEAFGPREGRAQALALVSMALASAIGGVLAGVELRLAYILSAGAGVVTFGLALALVEPPRTQEGARAPREQLRAVMGCLRRPKLGWVFGFVVAMTVFDHVPYELAQPYLGLLLGPGEGDVDPTPVAAGAVAAVGMLFSAFASRRSVDLSRRLGPGRTWLVMLALQGIIIVALGVALHPAIAVLLLFRGIPGAVMRPTVGAVVHPLLSAGLRATYLSVQSLAGRLAFSLSLLGASRLVGGMVGLELEAMERITRLFGVGVIVVFVVLFVTRGALRDGNGNGNGGI